MPGRKPKQTSQKTAKVTATRKKSTVNSTGRKGPGIATAPTAQRKSTRGSRRRGMKVKPKASWKPVSQSSKDYILHSFDAAVRLVTHKIPDNKYTQVHDALISARNQVAVSMETLPVPPCRQDYRQLSTTLVGLKELKQQLEQRHATLTHTLDCQESELQKLQDEKTALQDFGKNPQKHHPLLLEPQGTELHLNFDTVH